MIFVYIIVVATVCILISALSSFMLRRLNKKRAAAENVRKQKQAAEMFRLQKAVQDGALNAEQLLSSTPGLTDSQRESYSERLERKRVSIEWDAQKPLLQESLEVWSSEQDRLTKLRHASTLIRRLEGLRYANRARSQEELGIDLDSLVAWLNQNIKVYAHELLARSRDDGAAFLELRSLIAKTRGGFWFRGSSWDWLSGAVAPLEYPASEEWNQLVAQHIPMPVWRDFRDPGFSPLDAEQAVWAAIRSNDLVLAKMVYAYIETPGAQRVVTKLSRTHLAAFIQGVRLPLHIHD